jgi:undecaprenyl-diphosphatase
MDLFSLFLASSLQIGILWYFLVFAFSFLESLIIAGIFIPGSFFLIFVGFLLTKNFLSIPLIILLATVGAIMGDYISFSLGKKGTRLFKEENRFLKLTSLEKGKLFFKKHGGKSILIGRFTGPFRSIAPFVAGTFKMDFKRFLFWNVFSAVLWACFYLFLGLFFGETWQIAERWATRAQLFFLIFLFFLLFLFLINQYLTHGEGKLSVRVFNLIASVIKKKVENITIIKNNKRFFNFIGARFKRKVFYGFPLTFLTIAFFYVLFLFFGFVKSFVLSEVIFGTDIRVENLLYVFRDDGFIKFFYWITLLGNWQVVTSFGLVLSAIFFILKKRAYIFALWISIFGVQLFDTLGKITFNRPRPVSAIFIENSTSFPSGHAAIAIAFYGFISYVILRTREGRKKKINVLIIAFSIIFLIGFSRMYLGLHYLSDVIGGYLLGALWLIIAISIYEWAVYKQAIKNITNVAFSSKLKKTIILFLFLEIVFYISFGFLYNKPLNPILVTQPKVITALPVKYFEESNISKYSETLRGNTQEPMSFLVIAKSDKDLKNLFYQAGWHQADYVNRYTLLKLIETSLLNESYKTGPMTPSFWNSRVHDLGFQKPTSKDTIRERHHVRFWKTNIFTLDGKRLYLGTASFDTSIKWFITHRIDPNIDKEREYLFLDLVKTGLIKSYKKVQLVNPVKGKNFSGDPFYTDGKAYILSLK